MTDRETVGQALANAHHPNLTTMQVVAMTQAWNRIANEEAVDAKPPDDDQDGSSEGSDGSGGTGPASSDDTGTGGGRDTGDEAE